MLTVEGAEEGISIQLGKRGENSVFAYYINNVGKHCRVLGGVERVGWVRIPHPRLAALSVLTLTASMQ